MILPGRSVQRWPCLVVALAASLVACGGAFSMLILHPVYSGSHEMILRELGERLVDMGHQVTQIRWMHQHTRPVQSSVEVITRRIDPAARHHSPAYIDENGRFRAPNELPWKRRQELTLIPMDMHTAFHAHCQDLLADERLLTSLRARNFTLALVDLIMNECGLALAAALRLPVIGYWSFSFVGLESHFTSSMNLPSVTNEFFSNLGPQMSFSGRVYNTLLAVIQKLIILKQFSVVNAHIQKYHPGLPDAATLVRSVNVIMVFSNFLCSQPVMLPPHVQMVGCPHCRDAKPLDQDMESFMASSGEHGVVVFSLGITCYDAFTVSDEFLDAFLFAFERLKQKVLMRFDVRRLRSRKIPQNVRVVDWFQQLDVLGHKKTKVFVSHCGMNGIMESLYMGVPILGVPILGDQGVNSRFLHFRQLGIGLNRHGLTPDLVHDSLLQLIYNNTLRARVSAVSSMWRSQWRTDLEHALHWINMTATHSPLTHLQMIDSHLSWYQYWLLDVLAAIVAACAVLVYAVYWCAGAAIRRWRSKLHDSRPATFSPHKIKKH